MTRKISFEANFTNGAISIRILTTNKHHRSAQTRKSYPSRFGSERLGSVQPVPFGNFCWWLLLCTMINASACFPRKIAENSPATTLFTRDGKAKSFFRWFLSFVVKEGRVFARESFSTLFPLVFSFSLSLYKYLCASIYIFVRFLFVSFLLFLSETCRLSVISDFFSLSFA